MFNLFVTIWMLVKVCTYQINTKTFWVEPLPALVTPNHLQSLWFPALAVELIAGDEHVRDLDSVDDHWQVGCKGVLAARMLKWHALY